MGGKVVVLEGVAAFSSLWLASFSALFHLVGWVSALFISFLISNFCSPLIALSYRYLRADAGYVVASSLALSFIGLAMLFLGNPINSWALPLLLLISMAPAMLSKLGPPVGPDLTSSASPTPAPGRDTDALQLKPPRDRRRRYGRPRGTRGKRGRRRGRGRAHRP